MESFKSGLPSSHRCRFAAPGRFAGRLELDAEDIVPYPIISLIRFFTAAKSSTVFSIYLFQRLIYGVDAVPYCLFSPSFPSRPC